ncbi:MAG: ABC transporter substrate-binding protein [Candidatus Rokubacteria bacterium]|nr:ABC transporter substrate-binding protein [Candidatus Rokubacteria bacterium]
MLLLQTTLSIAVAGPPTSPEYLAVRVAEAEGYFADEGLRVTLRSLRGEPAAAEALAQGRTDLAATSVEAALRLGHLRGEPPRLVFGLTAASPAALLIAPGRADSIRGLDDLAGKTVGIPSPGTPESALLHFLLARAGVPPQRVTITSHGDRGLAGAIGSGAVAAAMIGEPWASRLLEDRQARLFADFRRADEAARWLGGLTVHAALFMRADSRLGARELTPLVRALLRATARLREATPDELRARLPGAVTGASEEFAPRLAAARGVALPDGRVTADALERAVEMARERAGLPSVVRLPRALSGLLRTEALEEVLASRPR